MPIDPIALARQLIDIPSTTGNEGAVGELLDDLLTGYGFETDRQEIEPGRFNLYASAGGTPRVVINSHIDTVPPWFASYEDEEHLYGRGACDTKGIIAAMIAAGERLKARGLTDFAFLFVIAEETDSIGAKKANERYAQLGSEFVVVGEPTESRFVRASKGALTCVVSFRGVAAHSAYPERGDSAITKLVAAVAEINATDWGSDPILGRSTANVGVIRGGEKANIIPATAELEMIFRLAGPPDDTLAKLKELVARHDGEVTLARGNPAQWMVVPEGQEGIVVAFNTDVPHLGNLGKPLLFGPGSILDAHSATEKIAKRELLDAVGTYEEMVAGLLGGVR